MLANGIYVRVDDVSETKQRVRKYRTMHFPCGIVFIIYILSYSSFWRPFYFKSFKNAKICRYTLTAKWQRKRSISFLLKTFVKNTSSETQGQSVGQGEKARRKFSSRGGRAPGYRLSPDHFETIKRIQAPDRAQKMLCIIVPNRRTVSFGEFVHDGYWFDHGLSGSCTKEMQAVRKLLVWYKLSISKYCQPEN